MDLLPSDGYFLMSNLRLKIYVQSQLPLLDLQNLHSYVKIIRPRRFAKFYLQNLMADWVGQ